MYNVMHLPGVIEIGVTGENQFRRLEFDMRPWLEVLPGGVGSIVHIRPGETGDDAYVAATTMADGILTWELTAGDVGEVEGYGQMEIWLEDPNTARGKSTKCQTYVRSSLALTHEIPEAQEAWLEQMTGLKTETVLAAQSAEDAREAAESAQTAAEAARDAAQAAAGDFQGLSATASGLAAGTSPTVNVTHDEGGLFNLAFGIPKGDKGDQGDPPTDSQVQTAANNYLSRVITNPDSPPLDRALSSNAAAAPADMVGDLKSALSDIGVTPVYEEITPTITWGYNINGSGAIVEASGQYATYKVPVTPGETYYVTASTNWYAPYYAYYDSSMNLVEKGTVSEVGSTVTSIENEKTTAPSGAAYLVAVRNTSGETAKICTIEGHEISALSDVIADVSVLQDEMKTVTIRNLFDPSKVVSGYYFNGSNQLIESAGSAYINQYIQITPAYKYVANADGLQVLTYRSDKTFIERAYNQKNAGYVMEFDNDVAFIRVSRYGSQFPNKFILSTEDAYPILTGSEGDTYSATKTATSLTVTIGKLKVIVNKYNDASIRAVNLWRTNDAFILANDGSYKRLWYNSDSDGVVKIKDEDDFIGGYHGDETQTAFHLMIDGVEYAESSTFTNLAFSEILLMCESNVYHCNTSGSANTIAFKRNKIIQFNHDGYTVKNNWVAQENVTLTKSYMGMLSVERYTDNSYTDVLLNGYSDNHDYKYKSNITPTGGQPDMTEVIFNTIYGDVGIVIGGVSSPGAYYGNVTNYNSSYDKRLKAYLATIDSNSGVSVSSGSVIKAVATTFVR